MSADGALKQVRALNALDLLASPEALEVAQRDVTQGGGQS